jgi:hypothetical protein
VDGFPERSLFSLAGRTERFRGCNSISWNRQQENEDYEEKNYGGDNRNDSAGFTQFSPGDFF